MTATDFIAVFNLGVAGEYHPDEEVIDGPVNFNSQNFRCDSARISNTKFKEHVRITEITLNSEFVFRNCTFLNGISFERITKNSTNSGDYAQINMVGCEIFFSLNIQNCSGLDEVSVDLSKRIDHLNFNNNTNIDYVSIISNNQIQRIRVFNCNNINAFSLHHSKLSSFRILRSKIGSISISHNSFDDQIELRGIESSEIISLISNEVENRIELRETIKTPRLQIEDNQVKNEFTLLSSRETRIGVIQISGGNYGHGFQIMGLQNVVTIREIIFSSSIRNVGLFSLTNLSLERVIIEGTIKNASLLLLNIDIMILWIRNFFNYSEVSLSEVRAPSSPDSELRITNSNLGGMELNSVDLRGFSRVEITSSFIANIKTILIQWFEFSLLNSQLQIIPRLNREVYRQLKQAMSLQGDTVNALKFKSLEMEQYHEQIMIEKPLNRIDSWHEVGDRFSIFINRLSNKNGLDWTRSAGLIIVITLFFFVLFTAIHFTELSTRPTLSSLECKHFFDVLINNNHIFWGLLDPTQKVKDVLAAKEGESISGWIYFLFSLHRIILAYLIFQTIAAFRKYLK